MTIIIFKKNGEIKVESDTLAEISYQTYSYASVGYVMRELDLLDVAKVEIVP